MKKILTLMILPFIVSCGQREVPVLKVGFVGHDHQTALYVAALEHERTRTDAGVLLVEVAAKKHYALMKGIRKLADVELYLSGGGSKMPTLMAQGHFEVGFGGVAAVAFFTDKGSPMKIIAPLHTKGDMLVVQPENSADSWDAFVSWVQRSRKSIRIGFKNPVAVAKLIFERALEEVNLSYTSDPSNRTADILMVHMKGEQNLLPGLQNDIIDGYVSNNPWCAIAEDKGVGKCIADLNELPPGIWRDHPCCCIAATNEAMENKKEIITEFLKLIILATNYMNEDPELTARDASRWIGTSLAVEEKSIPTSGFSTNPTEAWYETMEVWMNEMNRLEKLNGSLKNVTGSYIEPILYDFSLLKQAAAELEREGMQTWY